jgi:hypothetical protein
MTSPRSLASGSIIGMVVPGTFCIGMIKNSSRVFADQVTPYFFNAGEYMAKPAAVAAHEARHVRTDNGAARGFADGMADTAALIEDFLAVSRICFRIGSRGASSASKQQSG